VETTLTKKAKDCLQPSGPKQGTTQASNPSQAIQYYDEDDEGSATSAVAGLLLFNQSYEKLERFLPLPPPRNAVAAKYFVQESRLLE